MRTAPYDYSVAVNGKAWDQVFQCVWEPVFKPGTNELYVPVRTGGKWTMAKDGQLFWSNKYIQCWKPQFNRDGSRLAAMVSPKWGRWTVAVDDKPWRTTYGDLVDDLTVSDDGSRVAVLGKENEKWHVCVDDTPWSGVYDMAYKPVFSPDASHAAVKVEKGGVFTIVVNGRELGQGYQFLESPSFSPDSSKILICGVKNGKYVRTVMPVAEIAG
jgi:predicted Rdx family selenoprotein